MVGQGRGRPMAARCLTRPHCRSPTGASRWRAGRPAGAPTAAVMTTATRSRMAVSPGEVSTRNRIGYAVNKGLFLKLPIRVWVIPKESSLSAVNIYRSFSVFDNMFEVFSWW